MKAGAGMGKFVTSGALFLALSCLSVPAVPGDAPAAGGHRGPVRVLLPLEDGLFLSAGADGFLGVWDGRTAAARERYQISPGPITAMARRPGKTQICVAEDDGPALRRVSVWDYREKKRLFSLRFQDPVTRVAYSAGGKFLIILTNSAASLVLADPETGEFLRAPETGGQAGFAATGRSERTMLVYGGSGYLSYWDLELGTEVRRFDAPAGIASPLLFGGGRFLAGFDRQGLLILDAASGVPILRAPEPAGGLLLETSPEKPEFACLAGKDGGEKTLYFFSLGSPLSLNITRRLSLPPGVLSAAPGSGSVLLGTTSGEMLLAPLDGGKARVMETRGRDRIMEIAASPSALAFVTEKGERGIIPLDYAALRTGGSLALESGGRYTRVTAGGGGEAGYFLFWGNSPGRDPPLLKVPGSGGGAAFPLDIPLRQTLQGADIFAGQVLFLDSGGNVSVYRLPGGERFSGYTTVAALDAAFMDAEHIVIGRGALSGDSPFLMVNILTGETVPLDYPAAIGARVYRGGGGALYGAAIDRGPGGALTALIRLNSPGPGPGLPAPLLEFPGEDLAFSIAQCGEALAATLGGEEAVILRAGETGALPFERREALPRQLAGGGGAFILLDADGALGWHDPRTGKLLALFHLYDGRWVLEEGGRTRQGPLEMGSPSHTPAGETRSPGSP